MNSRTIAAARRPRSTSRRSTNSGVPAALPVQRRRRLPRLASYPLHPILKASMADDPVFYRAHAAAEHAAAEAATLDNVRHRCERAERAWTAREDRRNEDETLDLQQLMHSSSAACRVRS